MQENEFNCKDCLNKNTEFCQSCVTCESPSGRITRPTNYRTLSDCLIRIKLSDIKPPLGLKPRYIHDEQRVDDICRAMIRYMNNKQPIPIEWLEEYNELRTKDNKSVGGRSEPRL